MRIHGFTHPARIPASSEPVPHPQSPHPHTAGYDGTRHELVAPLLATLRVLINPRDPTSLVSMAMECLPDLFPAGGPGRRRSTEWLDQVIRDAPAPGGAGGVDIVTHMGERLRATRRGRRARAASDEPSSSPPASASAARPFDDDSTTRALQRLVHNVLRVVEESARRPLRDVVAYLCKCIPKLGGKVFEDEEEEEDDDDDNDDNDDNDEGSGSDSSSRDSSESEADDGEEGSGRADDGYATDEEQAADGGDTSAGSLPASSTPPPAPPSQRSARTPASASGSARRTQRRKLTKVRTTCLARACLLFDRAFIIAWLIPSSVQSSNPATNSQREKLAKALAEEAGLFDNETLPYRADEQVVVLDEEGEGHVEEEEGQAAEAAWIVRARHYIDHVSAVVDEGLAFENESLTSPDLLTFHLKCE